MKILGELREYVVNCVNGGPLIEFIFFQIFELPMLSEKFISSQLTVIVLQKLNDGLNFDQAGDGEQLPPDETDL